MTETNTDPNQHYAVREYIEKHGDPQDAIQRISQNAATRKEIKKAKQRRVRNAVAKAAVGAMVLTSPAGETVVDTAIDTFHVGATSVDNGVDRFLDNIDGGNRFHPDSEETKNTSLKGQIGGGVLGAIETGVQLPAAPMTGQESVDRLRQVGELPQSTGEHN